MTFFKSFFQGDSLRAKVIKSSIITFATYGIGQSLRLASNLILTRLLYPEAFGIMAIATVVLVGLTMLTDMGLQHSIIQNKNGTEEDFRNTAWTLQIIKGFFLWILCCCLAYPISITYDETILLPVVCALGTTLFIKGFNTTAIALHNKELRLLRISLIELFTQVLSLILTIAFTLYLKSVWALVWGNIISSVLSVIVTHRLLNNGFKHSFKLEKIYLEQIISYGKWIFLSSLLSFLTMQGDRILLGKILSLTELGIFTIAVTFAEIPRTIMYTLHRKVFFPLYSEIQGQNYAAIQQKVLRSKLLITLMLLPLAIVLLFFGHNLVSTLYDERYTNAGWMLQILAIGIAIQVSTDIGPLYLGLGKPAINAVITGARAFLLISSMILGFTFLGSVGLVLGISLSSLLYYLFDIIFLTKFKVWFWKLDLTLLILIGLMVYLCYEVNIDIVTNLMTHN